MRVGAQWRDDARATSALKKASDAAGADPLNGVTRNLPRIIEP